MLFNSVIFLFAFLPLTYAVFWILRTKEQRYVWLSITGYVFYGAWNWRFCGLMAFSTIVSYVSGLLMLRWDQDSRRRRLCLVAPVTVDLMLLGFFKYANFSLASASDVLRFAGMEWSAPPMHIVLPVGISFYTFHTISYMVDAYRRVITPTRNFFEFACYVSLFSQLVAGPIVRFRQIEEDLEQVGTTRRGAWDNIGYSFFILGLAQKILVADPIAAIIDPALKNYPQLSTAGAWGCMLGYTYQLYFDFAGYSNMAVGLGYLFGIRIPQNFNTPYRADSIGDFWRRWHMSLSSCLRDYLYVPLGGNRGSTLLVYRNLMITMVLGGLWHGANWTFVIWGAYHGLLLSLMRRFAEPWERLPLLVRRALTFLLVVVGWVFFRAENFTMAESLLGKMFGAVSGAPVESQATLAVLLVIGAVLGHLGKNTFEMSHDWKPAPVLAMAGVFLVCLLRIYTSNTSPFLYFQF